MQDLMSTFFLAAIFFIPTIVACLRHHRNAPAIFGLNLLLGWTGLGWIIAAIWALTANVTPAVVKQ